MFVIIDAGIGMMRTLIDIRGVELPCTQPAPDVLQIPFALPIKPVSERSKLDVEVYEGSTKDCQFREA
ncbi:hypothetical protein M2426_004124 [Pseudomonas moraviensis]|uniref:hypothetical protein n=1 Tax=Pseudomonas moraviensis TaxID=321662 RepID=UPI003D1E71A0